MISAAEYIKRYQGGMNGASQRYKDGVNGVTESPNAKAADAADAYLSGVQESVSNGNYRNGNLRVQLPAWKQACADKGAPRLATGALAAAAKQQQVIPALLQHIEAGRAQLPPRGSKDQNRARMNMMFDHMSQFRRQ